MTLTSRQRVLNALNGDEVDIAPVANPNSIVTRELQDEVKAYFPEAHHNAEIMTELALAGHRVCGYDNVFPVFGAGTHEAGAMGCEMDWGDPDNLPAILGRIWDHPDQIEVPEDLLGRLDITTVLDAIRMLREELGDEVAIFGKAYGPWSLAYHFFGIEPFLMDTFRDPPRVHAILDGLKEFTTVFGKAQIEAGADAINVCEHITADLIRPDAYSTYLLPVDQAIAAEFSVPVILHCCGKTLDRVHLFNQNDFESFNFESANDAMQMRSRASMTLVGNINNPKTILDGTPEDVEREVFYALNAGVEVLAPECAAPMNGRLANITAVREAPATSTTKRADTSTARPLSGRSSGVWSWIRKRRRSPPPPPRRNTWRAPRRCRKSTIPWSRWKQMRWRRLSRTNSREARTYRSFWTRR